MSEKRTKRTLSSGQNAKLYLWLSEQRERIERDHLSQENVASEATQALQFTVTLMHVKRMASDIGLTWSGGPEGPLGNLFRKRDVRIAALEEQVKRLSEAIAGLIARNGEPLCVK